MPTLTPSPVAAIVKASAATSTWLVLAPSPRAAVTATPTPTLHVSPATRTLTPVPVALLTMAAEVAGLTGAVVNLTPSPLAVTGAVPVPAVPRVRTVGPSPASVATTTAAPTAVRSYTLAPSPAWVRPRSATPTVAGVVRTSGSSRGLLLRGVAGSRTAVVMTFTQGTATGAWLLPFTTQGVAAAASRTLPWYQGESASARSVLPFSSGGPIRTHVETPFAVLDARDGVDAWGGIIAPQLGWHDPTPPLPLGYHERAVSWPGVRGHWRMEAAGATEADVLGMSPGAFAGTWAHAPGMLLAEADRSAAFAGGDGHLVLADDAEVLHPGDSVALSFWMSRLATGAAGTVWSAGDGDLLVGVDAGGSLRIAKQGAADIFVTTPTYDVTGRVWHVLAYKQGAAAGIVVDGVAVAGTFADATLVASATAPRIGRRTDDTEGFDGRIGAVTLYGAVDDPVALAVALHQRGRGLG